MFNFTYNNAQADETNRYVLDDEVKKMMLKTTITHNQDIPRWLSIFTLTTLFLYIPVNICMTIPNFLSDSTSYINGKYSYTHLNEALQLKDLLKNGTLNFWFSGTSLGYPMLMSSHPLPCVLTASVMVVFESFVAPLCIYRWFYVLLIALIPITWYRGARTLLFSRVQSLAFAMLALCVDSKNQTGLEMDAYFQHGLYPQLFGMVLLPMTASRIYVNIMQIGNGERSSPIYLLCLTYLCHTTIGIYCSILAFCTLVVYLVTKDFSKPYTKFALHKVLKLHLGVVLYLSGWIIPSIISYPYHGEGSNHGSTKTTMSYFVELYTNGFMFDYQRRNMWITIATAIGYCITVRRLYSLRKSSLTYLNHKQLFAIWLLLVTVMSFLLCLDVKVSNQEGSIIGFHFCGLLLAAIATGSSINSVLWFIDNHPLKKYTKMFIVSVLALAMIKSAGQRMCNRVSLVEANGKFREALDVVKQNFSEGRMLVHSKLGTGGAWDLENIPYLTGKPGLLAQSRGHDDILSMFYLESMTLENTNAMKFASLLRLYNVHYLAVSTMFPDHHYLNIANLELIQTVEDIQFYRVKPEKVNYGYFDFVHLPGFIDGNLNYVRELVVSTLTLYAEDVLFYLNPRRSSHVREESDVNVQVLGVPFFDQASYSDKSISLVSWKLKNRDINSDDAIHILNNVFSTRHILSHVVEEKSYATEYHAVVNVASSSMKSEQSESLLLKVSYHPFWRCVYFPVDLNYTLQRYNTNIRPRNRSSITVHHVSPNLLAATLPVGRYHVIFRYRFPGILKLLSLTCVVVFLNRMLGLRMEKLIPAMLLNLRKDLRIFASFFTIKVIDCGVAFYYSITDILVPSTVKTVFSYVCAPMLAVKQNCSELTYVENAKNSALVRDILQIISKSHNMIKYIASNVFKKDIDVSACGMKDKDFKNAPVKERKRISENMEDKLTDLDLSYSSDSVFNDNKFGKVSPPTPPKHIKKSYRKKHARMMSSEEKEKNTFLTRKVCPESPGLETVILSLRKNSLSPKLIKSEALSSSSARVTDVDNIVSSSTKGHGIIEAEGRIFDQRMTTLLSDSNPNVANWPKDTLVPTDDGDMEHYEDNDLDTIMANYVRSEMNFDFQRNDDAIEEKDDFNRSMGSSFEDSFSPECSSSPDLSASSPDEFSSSPDGHSSPDSSFEYRPNGRYASSPVECNETENSETAIQSDLYHTHIPESNDNTTRSPNDYHTTVRSCSRF